MASDHIRASDRDRDAVVGTLRDAFSEGRLTLEEFHERTAAAYAGRTWGDLRELTTDLPVQPALGADLPPGAIPVQAPQGRALPGQAPSAEAEPAEVDPAGAQPEAGFPVGAGVSFTAGAARPGGDDVPPAQREAPRGFGPVLPVVGIWVLFALAMRSEGGAVAFLLVMVLLMLVTAVGRRGGRR